MTTLTFQNTTLSVIPKNNQIFFSISDIANALGYKETNGVTRLYNSHQDEFTENMTALVDMQTKGGMQKVRIFSLRGCHLIGMLSHTKVAKDFRKWVLDILDKETNQPQQQIAPVEKTFTHTHTESDIRNIIWGHFEALRMLDFIREITPALEALGSKFAPDAYSTSIEYGNHLNYLTPIIHAMTNGVDFSDSSTPLHRIEQELAKPKTKRIYR